MKARFALPGVKLARIAVLAFVTMALGAAVALAQTTYTWNQTGTAAYGTPTNWTPNRTTPAADDILVFDNGANTTVTGVPTQTIGRLVLSNDTDVNLQGGAIGTVLTIAGGAGVDLDVPVGSLLLLDVPTNTTTLFLASGATGSISGNMGLYAAAHKLNAADAGAIVFNSGARLTQGAGCTGNVFTNTGTANAIVFAAGSTFEQDAGANPFGLAAPNSKVVFQTGSLFRIEQNSAPAFSGRTYANFEVNIPTFSQSATGSGGVSIDNLTMTSGTLNLNLTGTAVQIKGNITVNSGATLGFNPGSAGTLNFNGTSAQTVNNSGTMAFNSNEAIVVANAAGVTFNNGATFGGATTVNAGASLATGATLTNNGTMNVNGTFQLNSGGFASGSNFVYGPAGTLVFNNSSGSYGVGTHAYWPSASGPVNVTVAGAGGITMNVARTVDGTFQTAAGVTNGGNLTLNGIARINAGGYFIGAPNYGVGSTLVYNTGGGYGRGDEWSATAGAGYPSNVQISSNSTLDLGNGGTGTARQAGGDVTIDAGSTLTMDASPMTATLTVLGNLTNNGTLTLSSAFGGDLVVHGDFVHNSTFNANNRAVFFRGSANQTVSRPGGLAIPYVLLEKSGAGNVILGSDLTVDGNLTFTTGKIETGSNSLFIGSSGSITGAGSANYVVGKLNRRVPISGGAGTQTWDIGDATRYTPVTLSTNTGMFFFDVTMSTTGAEHPDVGASGLDASKSVNRYFTAQQVLTNGGFANADLTFNFDPADVDGGANPSAFVVKKYDAPNWSATGVGTRTATSTQATGVTSFSDFAIGEVLAVNHTITASAGPNGSITPSGAVVVADGGSQKFDIVPDACYHIAQILVDGNPIMTPGPGPHSIEFQNVTQDRTISASFAIDTYQIQVTAQPGGDISPGSSTVNCGDDITFTITPADKCSFIQDVLVDNVSIGPQTSYTFTNVQANHTIEAIFGQLGPFTITSSAGPGGMISPNGATGVPCGASQGYTIVANVGYTIQDVVVDNVSVGPTGSYTFNDVQANHTIAASFASVAVNTTTSLTSSLNPSTCGQAINLIATVSPNTAGGTVEFFDGGLSLGTAPVSGGTATLAYTSVSGHRTLTAQYGGDFGHNPSTSGVYVQNVHCTGSVTTVVTTPCDSAGWQRANVRDGGTVDITGTYPHATGSLEFGTTVSNSKADFTHPNVNGNLLSTLSALAVDLYRSSNSTVGAHFAPAVRLLVDDGAGAFSLLIWEPVYNGYAAYPTDTWTSHDLFKGNFWMRAFGPGRTIDLYNRTLSDWLQPGTVMDGGGDVSNPVGPNARVWAFEVGVGSGWAGTFSGAADNFHFGFAGVDSLFDFETVQIVATAGPGGTIDPIGTLAVACGASQSFTITPQDKCWVIADVLVDNVSVGPQTSYTFNNVTASHTIHATFTQLGPFTITASATAGGSISPNGPVSVDCGAGAAFSMTADPGYTLVNLLVDNASVGAPPTYTFDDVQANHTIHAIFSDVTPPSVTVIEPNGGETILVGTTTKLEWSVAAEGSPVTDVDLWISRDNGATWEKIASGAPNTGTYDWFVTGPGTNVDPAPVFSALLRVDAVDAAGNAGSDQSDAPFSIYDLATEAMVSMFQASAVGQAIELRWRVADAHLLSDVRIERSELETGPWIEPVVESRVEDGATVVTDRTVLPDRTYYYRLVGLMQGQRVVLGQLSGAARMVVRELALAPVAPNPSRGLMRVEYSLPRESRVRLSIVDIQGREIAVLADGVFAAGRYQTTWSGRTDRGEAPAGIYFVRCQALGRNLTQRIVRTK